MHMQGCSYLNFAHLLGILNNIKYNINNCNRIKEIFLQVRSIIVQCNQISRV